MYIAQRKNSSTSAARKKKVSKELLAALKNTQKLPPSSFGRFPGEAGYPIKDAHYHEIQRRTINRPELARVDEKTKPHQSKATALPAPTSYPIEDILEDDIDKIAHEKIRPAIQKENEEREGKSKGQQPKIVQKKAELPHIQEKETQNTHNTLVQSVYYPEGGQYERYKEIQIPMEKGSQNRPRPQKCSAKENILIQKLYQTDRKREKPIHHDVYHRDPHYDPYRQDLQSKSRSPDRYDRRYHADYEYEQLGGDRRYHPITKEELYREYAQRHRTNTLPSQLPEERYHNEPPRANKKYAPIKAREDFNEEMLYPETIKTTEKVIINKGHEQARKPLRKELKNISNRTQEVLYPQSGSSKYNSGYSSFYGPDRHYERYGKPTQASYYQPKESNRHHREQALYRDLYESTRKNPIGYGRYLDVGFSSAYRPLSYGFGRLY